MTLIVRHLFYLTQLKVLRLMFRTAKCAFGGPRDRTLATNLNCSVWNRWSIKVWSGWLFSLSEAPLTELTLTPFLTFLLLHGESRYAGNHRCPRSSLTLLYHQWPLPHTFALQPLFPTLFSFSCSRHIKCSFQHCNADTHLFYCCCMLHLGVYLIRNLVKIPFHQLACLGISPNLVLWEVTGSSCQTGQPGSWSKGAAGTEQREVWSIRAGWEMRLWKVWVEC